VRPRSALAGGKALVFGLIMRGKLAAHARLVKVDPQVT